MKKLLFIILIASGIQSSASRADTTAPCNKCLNFIRDTVYVPVYLVDVTDTVAATIQYKKSERSSRVYMTKGYALVRGFKVFDGQPKWATKPEIVGALDSKKRRVNHFVQAL